jgi:predicted ATP-grasp superfamily ATP-dependent carboligase
MRVFVYEHLCAVPGSAPSSLRAEGRAMLSAVLADFAAVPDVEVATLLAADLSPPLPLPPAVKVRTAADGLRVRGLFRSLAAGADWTLVIAPETDLVLWRYCCWVEDVGGRLLGPSPEGVARATDKLALAERWQRAEVPTPWAWPVHMPPAPRCPYPRVLKPRDGAGSQATFLIRDADEEDWCVAAARAEGFGGELICTPYFPGTSASVVILIGPQRSFVLPGALQQLSDDGRFRYLGGTMPLPTRLLLNRRTSRLAEDVIRAVPSLFGYVGVDVVLGEQRVDGYDCAIEINPRLTTSYLGYRRLCKTNLAAAMLTVCQGGTPQLDWHPGPIRFSPHDDPLG